MKTNAEHVDLIINGDPVSSDDQRPVIDPATNRRLWTYSSATTTHAVQAVESASIALQSWSAVNVRKRAEILQRAADLMLQHQEELKQTMMSEVGADDAFVDFNIHATVKQLRDLAGRAVTIQGKSPSVEDDGRSALVLKAPYGVVLGIAPWNAPYILGTRSFAAALVMGNTAVVKGSEMSPKSFKLIVDIFYEAGLPPGCLNLIFVAPEHASAVTTALIKHSAIAKISFTGSTAIGRVIARMAAECLKPVLLELGGKASAIVFQDADLAKAAKEILIGGLLHSGQVCMATERVLVEASIASKFTQVLQDTFAALKADRNLAWIGNPILISNAASQKTRSLVSDALRKGATSLLQQAIDKSTNEEHSPLQPAILGNVKDDMDIYYQESFGPILTVHTFASEAEALRIANDTEYGLVGAIFTNDLRKALRIAKGYRTGAVHINSMSIHDEASLPHGGTKASGYGRFNADEGLMEWVQTKVITWDN
ncbi:Salicylaldehyde dehydrogenase [Cyphellophora attinorum]|uniref:Salicylaldehyde dehydrogenase n=1 Tax=Cyphellophora attinorum TaxID=1664694 RepID=A0A0N1NX39_9EURO|nr:Salicylaldehyde dehydrogenase [Phialophora attinorum]KPI34525.1 Salicylaldehyde dehydrogenase [Phialophora attinorum]